MPGAPLSLTIAVPAPALVEAPARSEVSAPADPRPFSAERLVAVAAILALPAALLVAGTLAFPVRAAVLLPGEAWGHWRMALLAAVIVAAVDAGWVSVLVRRRRSARASVASAMPSPPGRSLAAVAVLRPEVVPVPVIAVTALVSIGVVTAAAVMAFPLWAIAASALALWIPLLAVEGIGKYQHYGLFALFGAITLLQIGHLGEHTTQVVQLLMYGGDLSRAKGVFGQLDFETVHFVWDTGIWLGLGLLLYRFGARNPWLWIAFAAASLHQVEHIYLFSIYRADLGFYMRGGFTGIMGSGGVVGSPLGRPYLHYAYNVCVVVPMVIAFWDQTRQVFAQSQRRG